jgi:short subunit dehydrogenase-like uncharacterized protein
MSDFDVVVYGATGFTGRLVCAELVRRKVRFAVAGRDRARLTALSASLGASAPEVAVEVIEAPLDDAARLQAAIARGKVVLACAGPFARLGAPVRDAALAAGRHYLDITGEANYMRETYTHDAAARSRNVALVNAVGFDVVPTDCAAALAAEAVGGAPDDVKIGIKFGGRATQGTTRSAVEHADSGGLAFVDGQYQPERVGAATWQAPFPPPLNSRLTASIPWGDLATAPRSTNTRNLRTFVALPPSAIALLPIVGLASKALSLGPIKKLAERFIQSLPEGPSDAERARAHCAVVAEATKGSRTARAWVTCGDGYDFTAVSAVECAILASSADFKATGALTPSQAFGALSLLQSLQSINAATFGTS